MAKIAIVTEDDRIWALTAWEQALPLLALQGHVVAGIWGVEPKLSRLRGLNIPLWYLRRMGAYDFAKLAAFKLVHWATRRNRMRPLSLGDMAMGYGLPYFETRTPNDAGFVSWMREQQVDVLLITVGHVLGEEVLAAPRVGVINKHAGLLPANRGLWPYFWAVVEDLPQGVSYHKVTGEVDAGPLLVEHNAIPYDALGSMIGFYAHVYGLFARHMTEAVQLMLAGHYLPQGVGHEARPHRLPDGRAFRQFRRKGGTIIRLRDIALARRMVDEP